MSPDPRPGQAAQVRRPYEPPAIKFEKRIEAFAVACTCNDENKTVGNSPFTVPPPATCGAGNFS